VDPGDPDVEDDSRGGLDFFGLSLPQAARATVNASAVDSDRKRAA
jgi:hypothetical protein